MSTYQELRGLKVKYLSSDPSPATEGDVWYNTTTGLLKAFVGLAAWSSGAPMAPGQSSMAGCGTQTAGLSCGGHNGTAANVTTLYNDGLPYTVAADTGLIGWWRMGDGTLTGDAIATYPTIVDETGNNNGTMTNMTSTDFEADVPE